MARVGKVNILIGVGSFVLQELEEPVEASGEQGTQKWTDPYNIVRASSF